MYNLRVTTVFQASQDTTDDQEIMLVSYFPVANSFYIVIKGIPGVSGAIGLPGIPGPPGATLYSQVFIFKIRSYRCGS